jgi:hypothetical protein
MCHARRFRAFALWVEASTNYERIYYTLARHHVCDFIGPCPALYSMLPPFVVIIIRFSAILFPNVILLLCFSRLFLRLTFGKETLNGPPGQIQNTIMNLFPFRENFCDPALALASAKAKSNTGCQSPCARGKGMPVWLRGPVRAALIVNLLYRTNLISPYPASEAKANKADAR